MSPPRELATAVARPGGAGRPYAALRRADAPPLARRLVARLGEGWLPRVAWTIGRTGRAGLAGIALLLAAAVFLVSTHREVAAEVEALRADVTAAQRRAVRAPVAAEVGDPAAAVQALPGRNDVPAILRQLFAKAAQAQLAVDTARYEVGTTAGSAVVRYQLAFPVSGPYPRIRAFIDATLAAMPEVALSGITLERKSIADGNVEAQIRMTVYTRSAP